MLNYDPKKKKKKPMGNIASSFCEQHKVVSLKVQ